MKRNLSKIMGFQTYKHETKPSKNMILLSNTIKKKIIMEREESKSKRKYIKKPKPLKANEKSTEPIPKPANKIIIVKFGF